MSEHDNLSLNWHCWCDVIKVVNGASQGSCSHKSLSWLANCSFPARGADAGKSTAFWAKLMGSEWLEDTNFHDSNFAFVRAEIAALRLPAKAPGGFVQTMRALQPGAGD